MLKTLFFLFSLVSFSEAAQIEWPFFAQDDDIFLNLTIGTPEQKTAISLRYFYTSDDLEVIPANLGGEYNNSASSTWKYRAIASDNFGHVIGSFGYETFQLGNFKLKNATFTLINTSLDIESHMGFGPKMTTYSFLQDLTDNFLQKKFYVAFDKFPTTGAFTFGSIDKKRCYNDWRELRQYDWGDNLSIKWGLNITNIGVGNETFNYPGYLYFTMYAGDLIQWPKAMHSKILKVLGSTDDEFIDCNSTVPIVFTVEDRKIELKPEDYLDTDMPDGKCGLIGETVETSSYFMFPQVFFRDHCMAIDNTKFLISIATRRPEKPI